MLLLGGLPYPVPILSGGRGNGSREKLAPSYLLHESNLIKGTGGNRFVHVATKEKVIVSLSFC